MTKDQAVKFFGSQAALARALGLAQPAIWRWGEYPPRFRQLQLDRLTGGALQAEPDALNVIPRERKKYVRKERRKPELAA